MQLYFIIMLNKTLFQTSDSKHRVKKEKQMIMYLSKIREHQNCSLLCSINCLPRAFWAVTLHFTSLFI